MVEKRKDGPDETDRQLIQLLTDEPRQSNVDLAQRVGVSKISVSKRLRRISDAGIARVVGLLDAQEGGYDNWLVGFVRVSGRSARDVYA